VSVWDIIGTSSQVEPPGDSMYRTDGSRLGILFSHSAKDGPEKDKCAFDTEHEAHKRTQDLREVKVTEEYEYGCMSLTASRNKGGENG